jgi:predicted nucleic acid-binding protein
LAWNLGAGETAVISLGLAEPGQIVILDDCAARRCARSLGLNIRGTLAVVMLAKQRGLIPSAAAVLRLLRSAGFRLDNEIIQRALASTVGEEWP